ncbi:MAG: hypothetical protein HON27_08645 [Candidatus Marinimicrobia bacterium]|nr:hypothetical protein [Candidatus Neomarinimicrobiota bacterium]
MYANENNESFPSDTTGAMASLNLLYDTYISDSRVFNCPSDTTVTTATNAGISVYVSGGSAEEFTSAQCSYGYDSSHTQADDADVALAADRPPAGTPDGTTSSANHNGRGQNVVYVDGHVEFVNSPLAGWYSSDGTTRDNIYLNTAGSPAVSTGGTDTAILHDG